MERDIIEGFGGILISCGYKSKPVFVYIINFSFPINGFCLRKLIKCYIFRKQLIPYETMEGIKGECLIRPFS